MSVKQQKNSRIKIEFKYPDPEKPNARKHFQRSFDMSLADAKLIEPDLKVAAKAGVLDDLLNRLGTPTPTGKHTFASIARRYVAIHTSAKMKPGGGFQRDAESIVEGHLIPFFEDKKLNSFRPLDLEAFRGEKLQEVCKKTGKPYKVKTVYNIETILRGVLKWVWQNGYTTFNVATLLPAISKKKYTEPDFKNFYKPEEMVIALDTLAEHEARVEAGHEFRRFQLPWHLILSFLFETGVRVGELAALSRFDVNLKDMTVRVCKAIFNKKIQTTKGDDSRLLALSPELCERLREHIQSLDSENHLLFPNSQGGYLTSNSFDSVMDWIAGNVVIDEDSQKRNLRRITPHGFRHSCGTALAYADVNAEKIRLHLGHADLQMVQRYIHLAKKPDHELNRKLMNELKKARKRLDEHFDKLSKIGKNET